MPLTFEQLRAIMPYSAGRAEKFVGPLNETFALYEINSQKRQSAFLAQVAHESGELRYTLEIAPGDAYENRTDLGNVYPGDGKQFKGRGLIQLTGRKNYQEAGMALGLDLLNNPSILETPAGASHSAGWFWSSRHLNELADQDRFGAITRRINGAFSGLDERIGYWLRARRVMGL